MSLIERDIPEETIHAYVDLQLSPDEHIRFERLMENDPALFNKVTVYKKQNSLMHDLFDAVLEEPVPDRFLTKPVKNRQHSYFFATAAGFILLCTGGLMGWFAKDQETQTRFVVVNLAQTATQAHVVYVPEIKHPVEVAADQEQHLVKWLSKRLGENLKIPSLNAYGYGLVGGRLLPSATGPAAQFMYENSGGERLTLYVRNKDNEEKNTAFQFHEEKEANSFYWIDGELSYVIVGNIDKSRLLATANSVYQQLSL